MPPKSTPTSQLQTGTSRSHRQVWPRRLRKHRPHSAHGSCWVLHGRAWLHSPTPVLCTPKNNIIVKRRSRKRSPSPSVPSRYRSVDTSACYRDTDNSVHDGRADESAGRAARVSPCCCPDHAALSSPGTSLGRAPSLAACRSLGLTARPHDQWFAIQGQTCTQSVGPWPAGASGCAGEDAKGLELGSAPPTTQPPGPRAQGHGRHLHLRPRGAGPHAASPSTGGGAWS